MRILYGVVGEGMGHAMRSRVILDELTKRHDVQVVVSGRAYDYLKSRAGAHLAVRKIWGYSIVYEDNEVRSFKTVLGNLKGAVSGWPQNVRAYFDLAESFEPDVVISDFESWSYLFAKSHRLPVISLDNIQIIDRCTHAPEITEGIGAELAMTKAVVKAKVAGAFHYYITTFFYPPLRKPDTSLHPPVLRPEILAARPEPGAHLLVYQTSSSNEGLPEILKQCGQPCRIYGMHHDLRADLVDGNLCYRPFSEATFIDDLRTARGVLANGGFTLLGETIHLGRPLFVVPIRKQCEQVVNARYVAALGYGMASEAFTAPGLGAFLERLPDFERTLARLDKNDNTNLLEALERGLTAAVAAPR